MAGRFDAAYAAGTPPPWDIGRPQPAFERLARSGQVRGRVLDAGCGTGEQAVLFAGRGCDVVGIDVVPRAIGQARAKARQRGVRVDFRVHDALRLHELGRFDHALDVGLLHSFEDAERGRYVAELAQALGRGGRLHVMTMRDVGRDFGFGPRRLRREDFARIFALGWRVVELREELFETNLAEPGFGSAWFASVERT